MKPKPGKCKYCNASITWMEGRDSRGKPRMVPVVPSSIQPGNFLYQSARNQRHTCTAWREAANNLRASKAMPRLNNRTPLGRIYQ